MMLEQSFFFLSLPVFLRFRSFDFSFPQWNGFLQDVFIVFELVCFLPFFPLLTTALGLSFHLYLIFDALLFEKMHLRMRIVHLRHLIHPKSLWDSAKELGLRRFFWVGCSALAAHTLAYLSLPRPSSFSSEYLCLFAVIAPLVFLGSARLSKTAAFACNNPLFQEHLDVLARFWKKPLLNDAPFYRPASFSGPKTFEINTSDNPHLIFLFLESFSEKNRCAKATPCFDRLATEGIYFSQFYANGTLTYRALLAGLFGLPPGSTSVGLHPYVDFPYAGLPEILKNQGYRSAFHHNGSLSYDKQREFLEHHFDEIQDRGNLDKEGLGWGCDDERLIRHSAKWLEDQKTPAFLTLFTISNHHPWFLPSNLPSHYRAPSFGFPMTQERFLRTTHYTDFCLGLFVDLLRERNLSQKTILFVLGDHGQPMGEHRDNFYNSRFIYEENVRVPLLILADGRIANPKVIDNPASQMDLLPTVMDLCNLQGMIPSYGASLMRSHPERTLFIQNPYSEGYRGCRKGNWKWIENSLSSEGELYDLSRDPKETENLAAVHSTLAESLQKETHQFFSSLDAVYQKPPSARTPSLLELDFSDQLITDEHLIDRVGESLRIIRLENCLLLGDIGIGSIFSICRNLEKLNLKGLSDLTDAAFDQAPVSTKLISLDLSDSERLTDPGVKKLAASFPCLESLFLNGNSLSGSGIEAIARECRNLTHFKLFGAGNIAEASLIALFKNNLRLSRLTLSDCSHLTDESLFFLKQLPLEQLWLFNAPQITDRGISYLSETSIRSLSLTGCPKITENSLPDLKKLKLESLNLNGTIANVQAALKR